MSETRHPGMDGSMDLGFGPDPRPADPPKPGTVTLTQEQFQEMLDRLSAARENDYTQALGEEVQQLEPLTAEQIAAQLPNPQQDPEGFKHSLGDLLASARAELADLAVSSATTATARSNVLDQAWSTIRDQYPEVAAHPDLIELATSRERMAMASNGQDIMVAMTQNLDGVVERIVGRAQASLRNIRGQPGQDEEVTEEPEILPGGQFRRHSPPAREQAPKPTSLVDELKAIQSKLGIY